MKLYLPKTNMRIIKVRKQLQTFIHIALITPLLSSSSPTPTNFYRATDPNDNFFQMISKVEFKIEDIVAMYNNVTQQVETVGCSIGICRTPIALWLSQSLTPCQNIMKEDCPIGLVCCHYWNEKSDFEVRSSDHVETILNRYVLNAEENFVETFSQDPIPGDSQVDV